MLKHLIAASLAAVLLGGLPAAVHATQQIGWHDLTVPVDPQGDPFFGLEFEPRQALEEFLLLEGYREAVGSPKEGRT